MRNTFCCLAALFLLISFSSSAQMIGMNASMFYAKGEFNRNIDHDPIGLSFTYLHDIGEGPWSLGGELGVAMYSSQKFTTLDNSHNEIKVYEEDCFYNVHAQAQYRFIDGDLIKIYGEGRLGMTTFFSEQHAEDEDADFEANYETHGTAFNLGLGGGARVNLSGLFKGDADRNDRLWLDASYTSHGSTRAQYRNAEEGSYLLSDASYKSLTNYDHLRVGISVKIR